MQDLYDATMRMETFIREKGFRLETIWECQFSRFLAIELRRFPPNERYMNARYHYYKNNFSKKLSSKQR